MEETSPGARSYWENGHGGRSIPTAGKYSSEAGPALFFVKTLLDLPFP